MPSLMNAGCTGCGWSGRVVSGWLPWSIAKRAMSHAPELLEDPARRRLRGGAMYFRVRLKLMRCPKCGTEGTLTRAATAAEINRLLRQLEGQTKRLDRDPPRRPHER